MKKIYVCSRLRGDVETNIENAKRYCEYVVKVCGAIPIAPHIYFTQFLDDSLDEEGLEFMEAFKKAMLYYIRSKKEN